MTTTADFSIRLIKQKIVFFFKFILSAKMYLWKHELLEVSKSTTSELDLASTEVDFKTFITLFYRVFKFNFFSFVDLEP